jgi:predicted nuclease of predicted toxin-antitoxin system
MKLLLDQGLPRSTVKHLVVAGIAAEHVGDLGMAAATDAVILSVASRQQSVVVTLDADFHHLLAASRATSPSVVRIRTEGLKGDQLAAILVQVLAVAGAELASGAVASVTRQRIRVRSLPIGR